MSTRVFIGWFDEEHAVVRATTAAREAGLLVHDVFAPFAIHGIDEAMGLRRSRLSYVCLGGGVVGLLFGAFLQYWTSVVSWPLNVGGKPLNSVPAFLPVAFELTVLFAALATVAALFVRARLRPRLTPPKGLLPRVTDDRFALALVTADATWNEARARAICASEGAVEISYEEVES